MGSVPVTEVDASGWGVWAVGTEMVGGVSVVGVADEAVEGSIVTEVEAGGLSVSTVTGE